MKVGLLSPYLGSNLGDNAILSALMRRLQEVFPGSEFNIVCLAPTNVSRLHECAAFPLRKFRLPFYACEGSVGPLPSPRTSDEGFGGSPFSLREAVKRIPGVRTLVHWARLPFAVFAHRREALRMLEGLDILIVAGGGQIDAEYAGALGHPYSLWLWARLAAARGVPFAVIGVGASKDMDWLSCFLTCLALGYSRRVSVRDAWSLQFVQQLLPKRDITLTADLAFGYPFHRRPAGNRAQTEERRLIIGVSPIVYLREGAWPHSDQFRYTRYIQSLATCVERLIASDLAVHLFVSESSDELAVTELLEQIGPAARDAIVVHRKLHLEAHLELMRTFAIVIASRLHGVILSQLAGVPTIAVSFHSKVEEQMRQVGFEAFSIHFDRVTGDVLAQTVMSAVNDLPRHAGNLAQQVDELSREAIREIKEAAVLAAPRPVPDTAAVQ